MYHQQLLREVAWPDGLVCYETSWEWSQASTLREAGTEVIQNVCGEILSLSQSPSSLIFQGLRDLAAMIQRKKNVNLSTHSHNSALCE